AHDVPLGCAPDEYDDLISGTCSHLPKSKHTVDGKSKYPVQTYGYYSVAPGGVTQLHRNVHFQINRKVKMNGKAGYCN
ncbi:hypothetical protein QMN27_11755, partial [Enterobacter asburiae]|nr:hypothetical protein [Enterobacter asburiae]